MVVIVPAALFRTGLADFCTNATDIFCFPAAQAHELGAGCADGHALHVQLNTTCHHVYIFFLRAGRSAMVTNGCTAHTGFNAGLILVITIHASYFLVNRTNAEKGTKIKPCEGPTGYK
jgi:hypothetical protein